MFNNLAYKIPTTVLTGGGGGGGINFSGGVVGDIMIRSGAATIGPIAGTAGLIPYFQTAEQFGLNIFFNFDLATGFHGVGIAVPLDRLHVALGNIRADGRIKASKGVDIASASTFTAGADGNFFTVTGSTNIDFITTSDWTAGSELTLEFTGTPTLNHNTAAPPANTAPLFLSASTPFVCTVGCVLKFIYNGTVWKELSRTAF